MSELVLHLSDARLQTLIELFINRLVNRVHALTSLLFDDLNLDGVSLRIL
jgi:hypothetical protein